MSGSFATWAIVAWAGECALCMDGDAWTVESCADWGADDHWHGKGPSAPGVYRWDGTVTPEPPDDFSMSGAWVLLWALPGTPAKGGE